MTRLRIYVTLMFLLISIVVITSSTSASITWHNSLAVGETQDSLFWYDGQYWIKSWQSHFAASNPYPLPTYPLWSYMSTRTWDSMLNPAVCLQEEVAWCEPGQGGPGGCLGPGDDLYMDPHQGPGRYTITYHAYDWDEDYAMGFPMFFTIRNYPHYANHLWWEGGLNHLLCS